MITSNSIHDTVQISKPESTGCLRYLVIVLVGVWICGVIAIGQVAAWLLEQTLFSMPIPGLDLRWLIGLICGLLVWLPLIFLSRMANPAHRPVYRTWRMAAEAALLMVPARFFAITDSQAVAAWQIAALGIVLLAWGVIYRQEWRSARTTRAKANLSMVGLALGIGGILTVPWAAWGALGSGMDVFLGWVTALLAGIAATAALAAGLGALPAPTQTGIRFPWLKLWGAPITLVIFAFGLGLNMNEGLMMLALPPLGWLALALARRSENQPPAWPAVALGLALGISGPLLWIDPDELAAIVTEGPGELIEWANHAGQAAFGIAILGAILAVGLVPRLMKTRKAAVGLAFAGVGWAVAGIVWFSFGHPGFYGEKLFVILKDQPDVSYAETIPDYVQRRTEVYRHLSAEASRSQAGLRQELDRWGIRYQSFYLVNALEVDGGPLIRLWLQNQPEVDRILPSPHLRPLPAPLPVRSGNDRAPASPQWNLTLIRANLTWDDLGATGKGIVIGQSDSGVDGSHPEFADRYRGRNGQKDAWLDPWFHTTQPVDIGGHGTHTLATALGKSVGVAPDAEWIGCVNLARNLGNPALYLTCMQFMLAPYPSTGDPFQDGNPADGAHILNNSWGCPTVEGCDPGTFLPAVRALESAGIFVVVSAGNNGEVGCGSVSDPPAIYAEVESVGAVDDQGARASFSSLGPVTVDGSNRAKPDISAPGEFVLSAFPQGTYETESGTSMAGPHVVGTVALMWSANPRLIGDIPRTREILAKTARLYQGPQSACGAQDTAGSGIVDAYAAVQAARQAK